MSSAAEADNFSTARRVAAALVREYCEAWNAGDAEKLLSLVDDDLIHDVNQGERREGKERFKAFQARMAHHYKETLVEPVVMVARNGERAALEYNIEGVYLDTEQGLPTANKQTYALPGGTFFAIKDGKISRISTYFNMTDWITQIAS
ncbi:MAG: ketosteroid isomerase-related protein [Pseudomonadota bacterium]